MPTFDFNYLFSSTQFAIFIFFIVIAFNCIFWIVDSLRGHPPFPSTPLLHSLLSCWVWGLALCPLSPSALCLTLFSTC